MANRNNHYESAFEAFLRKRAIPYIAVDEAKRSLLSQGGSIKSLDFIVAAQGARNWLIDVKGRRFPSGDRVNQYWKNWSPREDLSSLAQWETLFGENFHGLLVFAYNIVGNQSPLPAEQLFEHRGGLYGFVATTRSDYAAACHLISPRWDTVAMRTGAFRRLARPVEAFLVGEAPPVSLLEGCHGFGGQGAVMRATESASH